MRSPLTSVRFNAIGGREWFSTMVVKVDTFDTGATLKAACCDMLPLLSRSQWEDGASLYVNGDVIADEEVLPEVCFQAEVCIDFVAAAAAAAEGGEGKG